LRTARPVRAGRDDTDVDGVLDGSNDTGGEDDLVPRLLDVNEVDAVGPALPEVRRHVLVELLGANVALSREESLDILLLQV